MHLIHNPINALNEIQFMASIKLLHVSAPGAIRREFFLVQRNVSPTC